MKDRKLYVVSWNDAWNNGSSYYREGNDYTPMKMKDVGYMMEENDETLVICSQITEDDQARHIMTIPWEYITDIEELI